MRTAHNGSFSAGTNGTGKSDSGKNGTAGNGTSGLVHERFAPRTVVISIAATGILIGSIAIFWGLGLLVYKELGKIKQSELHRVEVNDERIDALLKAGNLNEARAQLEKAEEAYGLTAEQSVRLDGVYLRLAKQLNAHGDKAGAIKLLQLIPHESPLYSSAQQDINSINSARNSKKKSHGKNHHSRPHASANRHHK